MIHQGSYEDHRSEIQLETHCIDSNTNPFLPAQKSNYSITNHSSSEI